MTGGEVVQRNVRGDEEELEGLASDTLKLRLQETYSTVDEEYELLSADDIRRRASVEVGRS